MTHLNWYKPIQADKLYTDIWVMHSEDTSNKRMWSMGGEQHNLFWSGYLLVCV